MLRHERARVDRDGSEFALVIFTGHQDPNFTGRIRKAMRSIDELGTMPEDAIGVLLPSTTIAGGQTFVRRVTNAAGAAPGTIPFEVYSYPQHWITKTTEGRGDDDCLALESRARLPEVLERVFSKPIPRWKRVLDVAGAGAALVLLSPVFLLVALYIKIVSPGPVLFRHKRVGLRGRTFTFLKFRTMAWGNDQTAHKEHIVAAIRAGRALEKLDDKGDDRIIPGGRVIRKLCVDELPQLINVLRGEMSLVGPRPCMPYEADEFLRWHTHRFDVLPGMTGPWQVNGKNKLTFETMIRLDIAYAKALSPWRDIVILCRTPGAILKMVVEAIRGKLTEKSYRKREGAETRGEVLSS